MFPARVRAVAGRSGLVAGTLSPIANRAGIDALQQGGTAADAAAVVALTQITTALGSYVSYAGVMELVYYDAGTRKVYALDGGWNSYLGEKHPATIPTSDMGSLSVAKADAGGAQGRKTLVPGFMAGIAAMHERFGKLKFSELFEPAVWYAENGITVSRLLAAYFGMRQKYLARTPEGRRFMEQAGKPLPAAGDRFYQRELAKTLREVSRHGAAYMYTGAWGRRFVEAVRAKGGQATMTDMKRYRPLWEEALSTTFDGRRVYAPGRTSEGGTQVLAALNLAEELKLDRMPPYYENWETFLGLSTLLQFVELGPYTPPEAADFQRANGLSFSSGDRVTKAYAKAMAPMLARLYERVPRQQDRELAPEPPHHSDAIVVVDQWGNVAALVHSINTVTWGTTGIVVGGVPIPDPAGFQQARLAAGQPGDRLPSDMAPIIVMAADRPALAVATVGSSLVAETTRILLGTIGNGLDIETIMKAPPLLYNFEPLRPGETPLRREQFVPEKGYTPEFLGELRNSGVKVSEKTTQQVRTLKGTAVVLLIEPQLGFRSVETPGSFGFATAY